MIRQDLLALEHDDLAALSNRGNVNRARRELQKDALTYRMKSTDGDLEFAWSDSVVCRIFGDHPLVDARCSCPATGLCRHILRSVLAYQRDTEVDDKESEPWDPGELLEWSESHFSASRRRRATDLEEEGLVVELTRGLKPNAVFHGLGHAIKFLVPNDGRYTRCDCAEDAPCVHALLAVRAFSRLAPDVMVGLHETNRTNEVETNTLDATESALLKVLEEGISNTPAEMMDRLESHENKLRKSGLVWPAEAISDLRQQHGFYHGHDARFSSESVVDLVGEFAMRGDAIRSIDQHEIPLLFVAGSHGAERTTRLGSARLVGLGTTTRLYKKSTRIQAMLLDITSGRIVVVAHHFAHEVERPAFANLARRLIFRGRHLHDLGSGQLIIKTGRLSSTGALEVGRAAASRYTQKFEWESLPSPVWSDSFGEVVARLETLPPASLRPRSAAVDFHALPIESVERAGFDGRNQSITALLRDSTGETATLVHSYLDANREGTESLMRAIESPARLVLVAGRTRLGANGLTILPASCVFETAEGTRFMVQPQVDSVEDDRDPRFSATSTAQATDELDALEREIGHELGDACLLGSRHLQSRDRDRLTDLSRRARVLGLSRIAEVLEQITEDNAADRLVEAAMLSRLYHELG